MTLVMGFAESWAPVSNTGDTPVIEAARSTAWGCAMQEEWGHIPTHPLSSGS